MASGDFAPVLAALSVMSSSADRDQKSQAHDFLGKFQKSQEAWNTTHSILASQHTTPEAKLFAATTLKGKITYDLDQIPREQLSSLRSSLLSLLSTYKNGPKPLRTQLCVCMANLAIQMLEWKNVVQTVGSSLGDAASDCVLEFLKVLPEEVTEGRKINLSEEDLDVRTRELLQDNADQVLSLLISYASSSANAASNPQLLECINSWLREIPAQQIVQSPLLDVIIAGVSNDSSLDASVDCISTLCRDTKEVDDCVDIIQVLYPRILGLKPKIEEVANANDPEAFKAITRLFAEAAESWMPLIVRLPDDFHGLVDAVLQCCRRDTEHDAVAVTFWFWYEFKQLIVMGKYQSALGYYLNTWRELVDIMIGHLQFPESTTPESTDLFDGDREAEDRFREFRHQMGDVLKDCCEVISVTECLAKVFNLIQAWGSTYAAHISGTNVPHWQELEAPLFAMRSMGRMVPRDEATVLPQVIPLIVQIPNHEKLRFQAVMALGRYTEWTANHPDYLQPQLKFIISAFNDASPEVTQAAALAFRYFGADCRDLLQSEVVNLHSFYDGVLDKLPSGSQEEITEGVSFVIAAQPKDKIYEALKLYCDPIIERLKLRANEAQGHLEDKPTVQRVADTILLLTAFIRNVQPHYRPGETHQAVTYCQEILPVLAAVGSNFTTSTPILECLCRCWRHMVLSYRTAVLPLLPVLAEQLATGFETTRQGCFLWATEALVREFAIGADTVDPSTSQAVYSFFESQAFAFLRIMNDLPPKDLPDVIEDFFRLITDVLIYYHNQLLSAAINTPIFTAAISALSLEQEPPLIATLHYFRDLLSYGTDRPNSSNFGADSNTPQPAAAVAQNLAAVKSLVSSQGESLVQRVLTGMMFSFPSECLQDASAVLLSLFEITPQQTGAWIKGTLNLLPPGSVKQGESERLLAAVAERMQSGEMVKIRYQLQDFTTSYRRRNVAPRDGLGKREAARFRFSG